MADARASTDLTHATLAELVAELSSRSDALVFSVLLSVPPNPDDGPNLYAGWRGSRLAVRGMLADLDDRLRAESRSPIGLTRKAKD